MPVQTLDPAPRSYAPSVYLLRRSSRGAASAPAQTTPERIRDWLLGDAVSGRDLLTLLESFVWRLRAAGLPLDRASLHIGTLHPQLLGFSWNWSCDDGLCDELRVEQMASQVDAYRRNPLARAIELGETVHADATDPATLERFPLVAELAGQGYTAYHAIPLGAGGKLHNAATLATRQSGGFAVDQLEIIMGLLRIFALHVERHIALRLAGNVLDTYLGPAAGNQVLQGSISRGAGQQMRSIIWASDMRGFTDLSDRLPGDAVLALLNAYFERLAGAVLAHGGEVLKFIGDGLLAVFPFASFADERAAARAALAAAQDALADLHALNAQPPKELAAIEGWQPLRTGIALHEGDVFFGNMGAPDRLDFTVIGRSVNATARVEALSKDLGRSLLVTGPVARHIDTPMEHLGDHQLRGLAEPIALYSPVER